MAWKQVTPFNFATSPIGCMPGSPSFTTSPGGGTSAKASLVCLQADVFNWMLYFTQNPIDPWTFSSNLWTIAQKPFEKQQRTAPFGATGGIGAILAQYQLSIIEATWESQGMRFYPGLGVVKEEMKPRMQQEGVGAARSYGGTSPNLVWSSDDPSGTDNVYYSEHPRLEWGGAEFIMTFPFAPTALEPLYPGSVNNAAWTSFVLGITFAPGTLKYIGPAKETSVVIPSIGSYTGLTRCRKSFLFHYRSANWNLYWRARDQQWLTMLDLNGSVYMQHTPVNYSSINWFL
jgi:hypothetical protein